jgi:hypothetical protein
MNPHPAWDWRYPNRTGAPGTHEGAATNGRSRALG